MSGSDKTEKPTPKRHRENRRKGHVAKSPELVSWAMVLAATVVLPSTVRDGQAAVLDMLAGFPRAAADPEPTRMLVEVRAAFGAFVELLLAPFVALCVVAVVGQLAQTGLVFSTQPLKPSLKRLNPLQGVKRMFSARSLWEVGKQLVRLAVVAAVAWPVVRGTIDELSGRSLPLFAEVAVVAEASVRLVRNVAVAALVVAAGDYVFQRKQHNKTVKMSKQEIRDEHRSSEGNAEVKGRIRSLQVQASRNRMLAAVGDADVVVVNPVHIAVALRYEPTRGAPRVVAKGAGAVAERIRTEADRTGVPIVESVPLARALHRACDLDAEIPAELYEGVARVLAFVQRLGGRRPLGGGHHRLGGAPVAV